MQTNSITGNEYCAEQIEIPELLPDVLKRFIKAAVKARPLDLIEWSCEYFKQQCSVDN